MSEAIHDSRRRLQQVWWGVLAGVVATLVVAVIVYAAVPSRTAVRAPIPELQGSIAP